jgi:CxxC motif-containing protein
VYLLIKEFICDKCENNCVIYAQKERDMLEISGNDCEIGAKEANERLENNSDVFTTLVRVKGIKINVISVKSSKPLKNELWMKCSRALSRLYVGAPIKIGDVVCMNILNTGADMICTKNCDK